MRSALPRHFGLLRLFAVLLFWLASGLWLNGSALAAGPADIEHDLTITAPDGEARQASLEEAMALLNMPSVSVALIDQDRIAWARAYGEGATPDTLYQAVSLSKLVAAIGAMRLVDEKRLALDEDVNAKLTFWQVPANDFDRDHPVSLRGPLSMTAGISVLGFAGYAVGTPLPSLVQILDGTPPANSPPVTVIAVPGSSYHYSGDGYEIVEALMDDVTEASFIETMDRLVLKPARMGHSTFAQPLPLDLQSQAASGHFADGTAIPGSFDVYPEHAAAGLWSTPSDLANLLILIGRAWRGQSHLFLAPDTAREILTPQNGGPYGLGAAVSGEGGALVLTKSGQNAGYRSYLILFPANGQGMVVMTNSDNGSILAEALVHRAGEVYGWPPLGALAD